MKIVVAIKQVPARDSQLTLTPARTWIEDAGLSYEVNEPDAYALEAALRLKEQAGGEVIALCAGPGRVHEALREALAKGADRAIHVDIDEPQQWDALDLARLLAAAVAGEQPDVIITGLQSDDLGAGQTGVAMAELLGLPHATLAMSIEPAEGKLRIKRELEGGLFQHVTLPVPALVTVQSGISRLRYATLMGIKRAKTKEVKRVTPAELGLAPAPRLRLLALHAPERVKQTLMIEGDAATQARTLVDKLRREARAL